MASKFADVEAIIYYGFIVFYSSLIAFIHRFYHLISYFHILPII